MQFIFILSLKIRIIRTYQEHDLLFITSPKFSDDGNRIVFNAVDRKGFSDIYIYDLIEDQLVRLTNDYYDDKDPVFGINDQQVIFSSDRTGGKFEKKYNLFSIDINNYQIEYITYLNANNFITELSPDKNSLLFTSDYNGVKNLYELKIRMENSEKRFIKYPSLFLVFLIPGILIQTK